MNFRPLYVIAAEIRIEWRNISPFADPYLKAMDQLTHITDMYICEPAASIVSYFLANASTFRGGAARRLKAELKSMLEHYRRTESCTPNHKCRLCSQSI